MGDKIIDLDQPRPSTTENALELLVADTVGKRLAIILHNMACTKNHFADCNWYFENYIESGLGESWRGTAHKEWLRRAQNLLAVLHDDFDKAIEVINALYSEKTN